MKYSSNISDVTKENAMLKRELKELQQSMQNAEKTEVLLQKSLRELHALKKALDESTLFTITNRKGEMIYVNQHFCDLSRYSKEELFGKTHHIVNSGYHPKEFFHQMWKMISKGEIWHGEIKNKASDGSYFWVNTTIVPLMDDKQKIRYYLGIRTDVTKTKIMQKKLYCAEGISEAWMKLSSEICIIIHHDRTVLRINEPGCKLLGDEENNILGEHWIKEFIPEEKVSKEENVFSTLLQKKQEKMVSDKNKILHRSGKNITVFWKRCSFENEKGERCGILLVGSVS